ncbi:hypothetical protein TWF730_011350 [Orbilia blumenaviensis]|uniref:CFEM domain-containing protein n=1 Tax=Orbilia blumenaviensis TaxID=1796055 RepID=A0AAV9UNH8_9PEZI
MKLISSVIIIGAAVSAYAQGPTLPECAQGCIQNGLSSSNCDPTDFKCQCSDTAALGAVMSCVQANCEAVQIPAIIAAASAICAEYGGTQVSGILSSAIASVTPSIGSEASSNATSVSGSQKILPTITGIETTRAPTSTGTPNGAGKNTGAREVGVLAALAGVVAII